MPVIRKKALNNMWRACGLAALLIVVTGCGLLGLARVAPPPDTSFETRITTGGLKFFVYEWGALGDDDNWASRGSYRRSDRPVPEGELPPARFVPNHRESFEHALEQKLAQTGYCRTGYYVLSRYFIPEESYLRGECKELATPEDRQRFGDEAAA